MSFEAAQGEVGDSGLGRRLGRLRVLAPLDAVDDDSRLAPALLDRRFADRPQGHPLQAGRPAGLDRRGRSRYDWNVRADDMRPKYKTFM